jgi:hypothetical protein
MTWFVDGLSIQCESSVMNLKCELASNSVLMKQFAGENQMSKN